ncbi:MAG TPA: hypothetical protein ENN60_04035 [archaeon]|nr:hypothetical protein [archaeon]
MPKNLPANWESFRKVLGEPGVVDVIVFGSSVRGKDKPGDLDVCVVWQGKAGRTPGAIDLSYEELFSPAFLAREDILADGFSLRLGKTLSEAFGYQTFHSFSYSLGKMDYNTRARFHAAMRKTVNELGMLKLKALVLVPVEKVERFREFLTYWKIDFRESRVLFPGQEYKFLVK